MYGYGISQKVRKRFVVEGSEVHELMTKSWSESCIILIKIQYYRKYNNPMQVGFLFFSHAGTEMSNGEVRFNSYQNINGKSDFDYCPDLQVG